MSGIEKEREPLHLGNLPKFVVSGTATQITAEQIAKLEQSDDIENVNFNYFNFLINYFYLLKFIVKNK